MAAAAILPLAALGLPLQRLRAGAAHIAPPSGALQLERVLTRTLSDGAAIVVTRRWKIAFRRIGDNAFAVDGEQTFAAVDAPPALAALASIEQGRGTSAMFPMVLDQAGSIVTGGTASGTDDVLRAIDAIRKDFLTRQIARPAAEEARAFMAALVQLSAEAVSAIPRDLFFPHPSQGSEVRSIPLGDGTPGKVTVRTHALADTTTGLLRTSERTIITAIGMDERLARERWSIISY